MSKLDIICLTLGGMNALASLLSLVILKMLKDGSWKERMFLKYWSVQCGVTAAAAFSYAFWGPE